MTVPAGDRPARIDPDRRCDRTGHGSRTLCFSVAVVHGIGGTTRTHVGGTV